jgi:hypothetical protein
MPLLDRVRNALRFISRQGVPHPEVGIIIPAPAVIEEIRQNAFDVVDEALLDPAFRTALQQRRHRDIQKIRELLQSPERIAAFAEREKEILIRLGAHREWANYFFHDLDLNRQFPAELLERYSPSEIFHTLDKLRMALALSFGVGAPPPAIAQPAIAQPARPQDLEKAHAAALHATFGVALILGNSAGLVLTLFAAPLVAHATAISYGIGGYACSRAYTRLTESWGL